MQEMPRGGAPSTPEAGTVTNERRAELLRAGTERGGDCITDSEVENADFSFAGVNGLTWGELRELLASAPSAPQPTIDVEHEFGSGWLSAFDYADLPHPPGEALKSAYASYVRAFKPAPQEEPTPAHDRSAVIALLTQREREAETCTQLWPQQGAMHEMVKAFAPAFRAAIEALSSSAHGETPLPDNRDLALAIIKRCAAYVRGYMVSPPESADWSQRAEWLRWQDCARMLEAQPNAIIATAQPSAAPPDTCDDLCMIPVDPAKEMK